MHPPSLLRIGTWNLDGNWSAAHAEIMSELACDVWLLTEVPTRLRLDDFGLHVCGARMGARKHWAGVAARGKIAPLPDPHPASAACTVDGLVVCSSILPWPLAGSLWPWGPADHAARVTQTVEQVGDALTGQPAVWGGDWNTPLSGSLQGFSKAAQSAVIQGIDLLRLQVPTRDLHHRNDVQASIDHIAVPEKWTLKAAGNLRVIADLSDHDPYWAEYSMAEATQTVGAPR